MRILIIIYDFPPYITGGSVVRTIKYIKFLKTRGFDITVLAVKRENLTIKNSFSEILEGINLIYIEDPVQNIFDRVKNVSSKKKNLNIIGYIINFGKLIVKGFLNNFLFPDKGYFWYKRSLNKVYQLIDLKKIDIIYGSFPEPSAIWLAYKISKKSKLPLIIDYRDLWSTNPLFHKIDLLNRYAIYIEKRILKHAEAVIFATEMAMNKYLNHGYTTENKSFLLWNGFDPDDFVVNSSQESVLDKSVFNFTYTGNTGDLTNAARNPIALIDAFIEFARLTSNVRLNFIGNLPKDVVDYVSNIKEIYVSGMMPHSLISQILVESDILIVILTKAEDVSAVPGKVYEYMAAGKFILALTEIDSQLSYLINTYNYGLVVKPDQKELILTSMLESMNIVLKKPDLKPNLEFVKNFNRKRSADKLEKIFLNTVSHNK